MFKIFQLVYFTLETNSMPQKLKNFNSIKLYFIGNKMSTLSLCNGDNCFAMHLSVLSHPAHWSQLCTLNQYVNYTPIKMTWKPCWLWSDLSPLNPLFVSVWRQLCLSINLRPFSPERLVVLMNLAQVYAAWIKFMKLMNLSFINKVE